MSALRRLARFVLTGVAAAALLAASGPPARGAASSGEASGAVLNVPVGARIPAMGGAGVAGSPGAEGAALNPANLAGLDRAEVLLYHENFVEGITFSHIGYGQPVGERSAFGLGVTYADFGSFDRLGLNTQNFEPVPLGTFDAADLVLSARYAHRIRRSLSVGVTGKLLESRIDDARATTGALDLGLTYATPIRGLEVGFAIRNLGPGLSFDRERDDLPLAFRGGASYRFFRDRLRLALDLERNRADDEVVAAVGLEGRIVAGLTARVGYNSGLTTDDGFSAGLGFAFDRFSLDYAFVPQGALGEAHRFAATVAFGSVRRVPTPPPPPVEVVAPPVVESGKPAPEEKPEGRAAAPPPPPVEPPPVQVEDSEVDRILAERALAEGQDAFDAGDLAGAEAAFERATRIAPNWSDAFYNLGAVRYRMEDYDGAARAFAAVVRLSPNDAEAWRYLGFAYYGAGNARGALQAWKEAARLDPSDEVSRENAAALGGSLGGS